MFRYRASLYAARNLRNIYNTRFVQRRYFHDIQGDIKKVIDVGASIFIFCPIISLSNGVTYTLYKKYIMCDNNIVDNFLKSFGYGTIISPLVALPVLISPYLGFITYSVFNLLVPYVYNYNIK
jgi:pectin methylesterase-like acyl-CoA thioesterase